MNRRRWPLLAATLTLTVGLCALVAAPGASGTFRFPEGKHGRGELKRIGGVPVLVVEGTPEQMGEQYGALAVRPTDVQQLLKSVLTTNGLATFKPLLFGASRAMFAAFPEHHARELEAVVKAGNADRDTAIFANTMADLSAGFGCATIVVDPDRSETGAPLFGRNFDWPPAPGLTDHILVTVYRPDGKHAFATVTVAGVIGCISGMNDAGLCVTINEIHRAKDVEGKQFNPKGTPLLLAIRRLLEECATVAEAEKLLRSMDRTTTTLLTVCDRNGGAVFEVTTKNVEVRKAERNICLATNHFRTDKLCVGEECRRYSTLEKCQLGDGKLGLSDVVKQLHAVNQGRFTIETMVFEPATLTLHLAYGPGPTSAMPLKKLELGPLFKSVHGK